MADDFELNPFTGKFDAVNTNVNDLIVASITFNTITQTNFNGGNEIKLFICDEDDNLII